MQARNDLLPRIVNILSDQENELISDENSKMWKSVANLMGERLCRKQVFGDGESLVQKYKDVSFYVNLDLVKYIDERNQIIVKFLSGVSGTSIINFTGTCPSGTNVIDFTGNVHVGYGRLAVFPDTCHTSLGVGAASPAKNHPRVTIL